MPSFELNKLQAVTGPRALAETDRPGLEPRTAMRASGAENSAGADGVALEIGAQIDTVQPPVDRERVTEIRNALRDGTYPLVPTKIADAMIAAQLQFGIDA